MTTQLTKFQIGSKTFPMNVPVLGRKQTLALLVRPLLGAALVLPVFVVQAGVVFTSLYSFTGGDDGAIPMAGLVQGNDGNFYGTTRAGGTNSGAGTVFQVTPNGNLISLYSFTGGNDGGYLTAGLVQGTDGNFYGTTENGGTSGFGTVFKISANGALISLYSFTGGDDGADPMGALVQGNDGNFYGTTDAGGTHGSNVGGYGTVFKITTNGALTSLYSFTGGNDGESPNELARGIDGNFYGTTYSGGAHGYFVGRSFFGYGTVFEIGTNRPLTTLYSFGRTTETISGPYPDALDGANPTAGLVQGTDDNFYGTTSYGGTNDVMGGGCGTVFRISISGTLTSLYSFNYEPAFANRLVQGRDGNFYGTTAAGGTKSFGSIFQISTNGVMTTLYSFGSITNASGNALDGENPEAGLVQGSDGNFYSTTSEGGLDGYGTIFRLTIVPDVPQLTIVASGTNVILTWPTSSAGFNLQSTASLLSPAAWNAVSPDPFVVNGQNTVTNLVNASQQFYRLAPLP